MSFYKPSNASGARTIDTSTAPNTNQPGNPYAKADPLSHLRGLVDGGGGAPGAGSGIRWDVLGSSRYEDDGLRALKGESDAEELINQEYIAKYAAAAADFFASLVHRRGGIYGEYRAVLEHFRHSKTLGSVCNIRSAFVDTINRHPEFIVYIAKAGVPVFGQILIDMAKMSSTGNLTEGEYRRATQMASSMVLTMEFISWLTKNAEGREKALNLTPEIKKIVSDLERFKDTFTHACTTFGLSNPYAGLVFESSAPVRSDSSMIMEAERALRGMTNFGGTAFQVDVEMDSRELFEQVFRTAQMAKERHSTAYHRPVDNSFDSVAWETQEVDFTRISEENKDNFDYRRLFKWIKDDWHFIPESDWQKVKHAFKRHPDQPEQEDSVLNGSFRVVKINFDTDDGWFSTIIRSEGLDMAAGFMDPKLLLPALEIAEDGYTSQITQVPVEEVMGKGKSPVIPTGVIEKLEGIPLITVKDKIEASASSAILAAAASTNKTLTANAKGTNATSFNTCIWEYFSCESEDDRKKLIKNLPFLFTDIEDTALSFFMRIKRTVNFFDSAEVGAEIGEYIDGRLTLLVNEWLISSLGYNNSPDHDGYLAVESIFEDYSELDDIFKETDEEAFRCFNAEGSPTNYLTEQMKLFVSESSHNKEAEEDSVVDKIQKGLRLVAERPIHLIVVNKRLPPSNMESGTLPLIIRRSKFPEFFHLFEEGFIPTMGDKKDIKVVDKIFQFDEDGSMWLFSYSSLDINVASMRRVTTRRSLMKMDLV